MQKLKANINTAKNTLCLPDIELKMSKKFPDGKTINLNALETNTFEIHSEEPNGDFLIEDDLECHPNVFIHAGLYNITDSKTEIVISNNSDKNVSITIPPIETEINNFETEYFPFKDDRPSINLYDQIRTQHLNHEEKQKLFETISKFKSVFYTEDQKLTFTNAIKHSIKTTDEIPVHTKSYRYPFCHKEEVQSQINKMLEQGIMRHSNSPYSSPIWVVPKKKDASGKQKWRLVVDYRKLNDKTIGDKYPISDITGILDKLGKCQYFTALDLASGFHQIEVDPIDIPKTAFSVEHGHYEYVRMPFGLRNAPCTFQRVMDNILREHLGKICLVYMDDVIIYSTSLEEHLVSISKILSTFQKYNLKVQLDKSELMCKEVAFLGHIVTPDGVKPNPIRIKAIKEWPIPKTEKDLRGFLGTLGYYRKFIKDFAKIVKPLTNQLRKENSGINHTPDFLKTFEKCKNILTDSSILQYPDLSKPFNLTTDASNYAIGANLSQGPINKDLSISFASRTLSKAEENYSTIEKELLAIVWAVKHFRPYLYGRRFTLFTDQKPLIYLFNLKEPNSKLVRWRLSLEEYDIKYKRFHSTITEIFRCIKSENDFSTKELFRMAVSLYNTTIHSATKLKPIEIFYGIKEGEERPLNLNTILENRNKVFDEIILQLNKTQNETLNYSNRNREKEPVLRENDEHFIKKSNIRGKTQTRFEKVKIRQDRRKTFIDSKQRKLHKKNLKRIPTEK